MQIQINSKTKNYVILDTEFDFPIMKTTDICVIKGNNI